MEAVVYSLLSILSVWVISYVLVNLDGPFELFSYIRRSTEQIGIFECLPCISFWVSLILIFFLPFHLWAFLGIWGGAVLIDKVLNEYVVH